jgi:hypothetical protein
MILGILMSNEVKIAVLETQVERLLEKQKELTERVRANEKVVAAIGLLGSIALAFIGAGYFAPKVEASPTAGEWIEKLRDHEAQKTRTPAEESINKSLDLWEEEDGSNGSTESEELLQLSSDEDSKGIGRGYDRCSDRSWIRFIQERTGKNCGCRHSREED